MWWFCNNLILRTGFLKNHPKTSGLIQNRNQCEWETSIHILPSERENEGEAESLSTNVSVRLVLALFSLLRKAISVCLNSLEMWLRNYFLNGFCVSVPFSVLPTPVPWHPQSSSAGCSVFLIVLWTWPDLADPDNLTFWQFVCVYVLLSQQDFLCSPSSDCMQGAFLSL